jgi:hypothetical protein
MSDPSLPGTPGTGPLPEPEPEGFREEQIEAERQRQLDEREEQAQLNKEAAEKYSGKDAPDGTPTQGRSPAASGDDYGSGDTPSKAKGASHPTTRSSTTKKS